MNNIRVITYKVLRTYVTKAERAGVRRKAHLLKDIEADLEEIDHEDGGVYETDFRDITKTYLDHKRDELRAREQLRRRIVKSKVFKTTQPRFLTYVEKDHIKKLHESNPDEWTPEALSKSFPALPETIRKVLRAKWVPKSVEAIVKYDQKVIENWKNLKTGQLALNPDLREHLMKFKDRKISLSDRETLLEKFVPPKLELPKPKSTFYSSIVKDSTDVEEITKNKLVSSESKSNNADGKSWDKRIEEKSIDMLEKKTSNTHLNKEISNAKRYKSKGETLSFDEFLRQKINDPNEMLPEERETLMETYKKHTSTTTLSPSKLNNDTRKVTDERRSSDVVNKVSDKNEVTVKKNNMKSETLREASSTCSSLDTFVKENISYMENDYSYTRKIRIPKNVYKAGMTYRVKDCYYDDDGEFLYRVPGFRC